ncbi:thiolase family protein [Elongatibacter sediminis]|uniref:Thiolase family protein n=1 Tax=Elongatibacter sediminis TaxID=3119006 RepID=A0AAW9R673_9GAMM
MVLACPVSVPYVRHSERPAHWWIGRALRGLADASGLGPSDIDGLCASSFTLGPDTAVALTQHFGLTTRWLDHLPMGGAAGIIALRRAARAVQAGDAEVVACVAGDTHGGSSFSDLIAGFSRFSQDAVLPYGAGGPNASFALITREIMRRYGLGREAFGKLCVAQRHNALHYGKALMKKPLSLEDYLAGRPIADPITLFDCVMPCAGAEGFLVLREERAVDLGLPFARILSTQERHNAWPDDTVQYRCGWALDSERFWSAAGVGPDDVDLVQTYDDYPAIVAMQWVDLGFTSADAIADFIDRHSFTFDGSFPHNTSGGQLSVGQAGAAGGWLGLNEALRQVTGAGADNQVSDARIACVSGFGMINYDRGLCSTAALIAGGRS